jgi:hypothetical protein
MTGLGTYSRETMPSTSQVGGSTDQEGLTLYNCLLVITQVTVKIKRDT